MVNLKMSLVTRMGNIQYFESLEQGVPETRPNFSGTLTYLFIHGLHCLFCLPSIGLDKLLTLDSKKSMPQSQDGKVENAVKIAQSIMAKA